MHFKQRFNQSYQNYPMATGLGTALGIEILFYIIEWVLWKYTTLCAGDAWHYYDFVIRMGAGFLGLWFLSVIYEGNLKSIFCGKISKQAWLFCIPFGVSFLLSFSELFCAKEITTANTVSFLIAWLTQIGSGFWEEIVGRGLLMCGLLIKNKQTAKGRFLIVGVAGFIFGFSHLMNFIYGNDIVGCLLWGLDTMLWGFLMAALYLLTSNLWLAIGIHTIWDIICKIPAYYMQGVENEIAYNVITFIENYVMYVVFLICAIIICVWYPISSQKENEKT